MASITPIFRVFNYDKVIEFYVDWLGFKIDWEDRQPNWPIYLQVSLGDIQLHLSEHHGDCTPGARAFINDFDNLKDYHQRLLDKNYTFNRPGIHTATWNNEFYTMEAIDPFGNRLTFNGRK